MCACLQVTTLDRVRTENGWLREQLEGLRQELAVEIQINQYRAREKSQIEARLAASEAEIADAQKIAATYRAMANQYITDLRALILVNSLEKTRDLEQVLGQRGFDEQTRKNALFGLA